MANPQSGGQTGSSPTLLKGSISNRDAGDACTTCGGAPAVDLNGLLKAAIQKLAAGATAVHDAFDAWHTIKHIDPQNKFKNLQAWDRRFGQAKEVSLKQADDWVTENIAKKTPAGGEERFQKIGAAMKEGGENIQKSPGGKFFGGVAAGGLFRGAVRSMSPSPKVQPGGGQLTGSIAKTGTQPVAKAGLTAGPRDEIVANGPKTIDLSNKNWRNAPIGKPNESVVYTLKDANTGEVLKVGKTEVGPKFMSRMQKYEKAGRLTGRKLEVEVITARQKSIGLNAEGLEKQIRDNMIQNGEKLPWDNTGQRLGRPGPGTPGTRFSAKLRKEGWGWNGQNAVQSK